MKSILGIGVNTLDYTILTNGFPIEDGKGLGYEQCDFHPGGPIPNALVCLSRLGYQTSYVGNTSRDNEGDVIIDSLKNEGVDVSGITRAAIEANKSFIISNNENGTRTVLWRKIPLTDYFNKDSIPYEKIDGSDVIMVDGLERECTKEILKFAKQRSKKVIYGAESTRHAESFLPYVDILVTPEESIKIFCGNNSNREGIMNLLKRFPLEKTFITEGEKGSYGIDFKNGNIEQVPSFGIATMDSTGAGDAYLAGIACSLMEGKDTKNSLIIASAIAALNCLELGSRSGLPNREQLKDFLKRNNWEGILK